MTVREYELVPYRDTVITYLTRETTETTTAEEGSSQTESEKGESETSEKSKEDRDIQSEKEEEKEPYDPDWIKYLFWILLLIFVGVAFYYIQKYLRIFQK